MNILKHWFLPGSLRLMCPAIPSTYPLLANTRKAPAICSSIHRRFDSIEVRFGIPGSATPCANLSIALFWVISFLSDCNLPTALVRDVVDVDDMLPIWSTIKFRGLG